MIIEAVLTLILFLAFMEAWRRHNRHVAMQQLPDLLITITINAEAAIEGFRKMGEAVNRLKGQVS